MTAATKPQVNLSAVDWLAYVNRFLDRNSFIDGLAAAQAIAVQSEADHGRGNTLMLEIQTITEFNARAAAEEKRARAEWLEDARAGFAALSQDDRNEFADAAALGMI